MLIFGTHLFIAGGFRQDDQPEPNHLHDITVEKEESVK
jgi:hypothetical protein